MADRRTVVFDIEANGLTPDRIWFIVCKDVDNGEVTVFREGDMERFLSYSRDVGCFIGHYILSYDIPVLRRLLPEWDTDRRYIDTLVVSKLLDCDLSGGHSIEAWATRLGGEKKHADITDWSSPTEEMLERCISDVHVNYLLWKKFKKYLDSETWQKAIEVEHFMATRCRELHDNGFHFSIDKCNELWYNLDTEIKGLDGEILRDFPPKASFLREVAPKITKHGTLNRSDFRWKRDGDLSDFNGGPFSLFEYLPFNPGSPSQIVERLNEAGWKPTEKTKGHIEAIRSRDPERIARFKEVGWKVSEENLSTLPDTAPPAAKSLAKRILLASRQRTLTEWKNAYNPETSRIHGSFNGIGAWTHRMSHTNPNTGNIARVDALLGAEMRGMWGSPEGSFLVGVDAESIQLRVLAHYIDDPQFTQSLLTGRKEDHTDPHSLNKVALGSVCASRNVAKTFIYAWLLGSGIGKVATILGCSYGEAQQAVSNFIEFYPGLKRVREELIPEDARRGYFQGFDGRWVRISGDDFSEKKHFCLAGYLQNGEATVMKHATQIWHPELIRMGVPFTFVNFVHDEWQTEVYSYEDAVLVQDVQAEALKKAGELLNLRCPMAGGLVNDHGDRTIGKTWLDTH